MCQFTHRIELSLCARACSRAPVSIHVQEQRMPAKLFLEAHSLFAVLTIPHHCLRSRNNCCLWPQKFQGITGHMDTQKHNSRSTGRSEGGIGQKDTSSPFASIPASTELSRKTCAGKCNSASSASLSLWPASTSSCSSLSSSVPTPHLLNLARFASTSSADPRTSSSCACVKTFSLASAPHLMASFAYSSIVPPSSSSRRSCKFSTASSCTSASFSEGSGGVDNCSTRPASPPSFTNFLRYSSLSMQMLRSVVAAAARMPAMGESMCLMRRSSAPALYASTVFSGHSTVRKFNATTAVCTRSSCSERRKSTSGWMAPASRIFRLIALPSFSPDARMAMCVPASAPTLLGSSAHA
mmetsp:Transcript_51310/g.119272  ORF Transcript_51310/g.119272 Transcript_51310/m.119272 type:complete len:354 (+) Transcript_51310:198-1259(+)